MISALSGSVTHVRAEEYSDIRTYGAPDVVRDWMLFGKTPEEARASVMIDALGGGFRQSLFMVADEMGFDIEPQLQTTHEMAVATAPIDSPIGPIQPGTVAAQRFTWEATVDGTPVVTATVNWLMGEEHLDPAWSFGPEGERFEVEITGDPSCLTTFKKLHPETVEAGLIRNPGVVATAMHCVNAIPYVCRAEPGLLTYLEMPLVAGRAAPGLHRDRRGPRPRPGMILDRFSVAGKGGDRHGRRAGDRTGDRHRVGRGRCGRRTGRPYGVRPRGGGGGSDPSAAVPSSCQPTSPTPPRANSW